MLEQENHVHSEINADGFTDSPASYALCLKAQIQYYNAGRLLSSVALLSMFSELICIVGFMEFHFQLS